jgi:hypothetical protein
MARKEIDNENELEFEDDSGNEGGIEESASKKPLTEQSSSFSIVDRSTVVGGTLVLPASG